MFGFDPYSPAYEENHDIWEWDGETWVRKRRAFNPGDSYNSRMVYDSHRRRCVLYEYFNKLTWEWDGADWHQMEPLSNDPGDDTTSQVGYNLAFDPLRKTTWMQCSRTFDSGLFKTWAYAHTDPDICPGLGVTLTLTDTWFTPGDVFSCTASICNNAGAILSGYPLFVVLDVFGEYFWGPDWTTTFDNYLDEVPILEEGMTNQVIIPEFTWPDGAGSASGIRFISCVTDPAITIAYGEIAIADFGWGE